MQLALTAHDIPVTPRLREHAERRLGFALGRFASQIRRVALRLDDVNGPKGGRDIACHAAVSFQHGGEIHVDGMWSDAHTAVTAILERLRAAVTHDRERRHAGRRVAVRA